MGYDLSNSFGETFRFQIDRFPEVYKLAVTMGWNPGGTEPPYYWAVNEEWSGGYFTNDGQKVTESDALELAAAIERAIPQFPNLMKQPAFRNYDGGGVQTLRSFVNFCRSGKFYIW